jgi:threonine/homoserine/homoserine lactone efflux protein
VNHAAFVAVALLLIVTPGPDMALVTRNALSHGRRAALFTAFGIVAGLLVWTVASVIGLVALLTASAEAFTIVRLAGAAYLVYLGVRTLLSLRGVGRGEGGAASVAGSAAGGSPFRQGMVSNLLNPKIAVLFTSLIPQFVTPGPSATLDSLVLAAIFAGLGLAWLVGYALVASAAAATLRRPTITRVMSAVTGVVLVGLGLRLATQPR